MSGIRVRKRERLVEYYDGDVLNRKKMMVWELDDGSPIEVNPCVAYSPPGEFDYEYSFILGNPKNAPQDRVMSFGREYLIKLRDMLTRVLDETKPVVKVEEKEVQNGVDSNPDALVPGCTVKVLDSEYTQKLALVGNYGRVTAVGALYATVLVDDEAYLLQPCELELVKSFPIGTHVKAIRGSYPQYMGVIGCLGIVSRMSDVPEHTIVMFPVTGEVCLAFDEIEVVKEVPLCLI